MSIENNIDKELSPEVVSVASELHDAWREPRKLEDGSYEPRVKKTSDSKWSDEHGTDEVDIANTSFEDLPTDWQKENADAAEVAYGLLTQGLNMNLDITSNDFIEQAAAEIHTAWLARENNSYARGGELDVPYDELPEDEKAKDRSQILIAIEQHQKNE